jgi:two-component system, OmpR family, sensor histidine kinase CiaH
MKFMFQSTRLKLTAWYLLIIMFVSIVFSVVIYGNVSHQIEGLIHMQNDRIKNFQAGPSRNNLLPPPPNAPPMISAEDLQKQEQQLILTLFLINLGIFAIAGGAGYFLAGRTLRPISLMMDEQSQFISDASHELRTPIATLRAEMEQSLLEKNISDQQARKLILSNLEELGTLQGLSNSLLKLAQIHTINNGKGSTESISLLEVIKVACNKVTLLAKKKNINIVMKVPEVIVNGSKSSLTEVFVILFDNAIKYSPENSKITVTSQDLPHRIKILVSDQGMGISKEDLLRIFERFFRADKSRSLVEGYGLGLSIAKKVIESHKGSIRVASKIGKGSIFEVILPLVYS